MWSLRDDPDCQCLDVDNCWDSPLSSSSSSSYLSEEESARHAGSDPRGAVSTASAGRKARLGSRSIRDLLEQNVVGTERRVCMRPDKSVDRIPSLSDLMDSRIDLSDLRTECVPAFSPLPSEPPSCHQSRPPRLRAVLNPPRSPDDGQRADPPSNPVHASRFRRSSVVVLRAAERAPASQAPLRTVVPTPHVTPLYLSPAISGGRSLSSEHFFDENRVPALLESLSPREHRHNSPLSYAGLRLVPPGARHIAALLSEERSFEEGCSQLTQLVRQRSEACLSLIDLVIQKSRLFDQPERPIRLMYDLRSPETELSLEMAKRFFKSYVNSQRFDLSTVLLEAVWSPTLLRFAVEVYCENEEYRLVYNVIQSTLEVLHTDQITPALLQDLSSVLRQQMVLPQHSEVVRTVLDLIENHSP